MVEFSDTEKSLLARCGVATDDADNALEKYMQAAVLLVMRRDLGQDAILVGRALQALQVGRPERPSEIFDDLISPIVELGESVNISYDSPTGNGRVERNGKVIGYGSFLRVAVSDGEKIAEIDMHTVSRYGDYEFRPMTFLRDMPEKKIIDFPAEASQMEPTVPSKTVKHDGKKPTKKLTKPVKKPTKPAKKK